MLRLAIYLQLLVLANTDDLLGVDYSFDVDFYTNFDSKKCDFKNMWQLVNYGALDIESLSMDSDMAIQALEESCSSSFPIIFVGGTLEFNVYAQVISQIFKLSIKVIDEDERCITSYLYQPSTKDFRSGWQTISFRINEHVKGYINLQGTTLKNEILLIDSFKYTPNDTTTYNRRAKRSVDYEGEDETEIIFKYKLHKSDYEETLESSGDDEYEPDPPPPTTDEPLTEKPQEGNTFWNPFTITLVSVGAFVVLAILVVGAYHYGKVRASNNAPLEFDDIEPPRTITIPRAAGISSRMNPSQYYNF